ncbi:MAG: RtcB family protein, partial [Planctomycetota bacterium]
VGYDINCGVRLLRTHLREEEVLGKREQLARRLFRDVPTGVAARGGIRKLSEREMERLALRGARWAVEEGYGREEDLEFIEEGGCLGGADPSLVSSYAVKRGMQQVGTLGSGNHFLEVDVVEEVYDTSIGGVLGLEKGQIVVIIHCGSRGYGHQIASEYIEVMERAVKKYGISLPDKQLACAPLSSPEAKDYLAAMACAANFAWANRQVIMYLAKKSFLHTFQIRGSELGMEIIYDVCHNIAKFEVHKVDGKERRVCVHRKGATRAFPPGHPQTPRKYREIGQPVLIPGDMGRYSYVLVGAPGAMEASFGSSCHGAGRILSRVKSRKKCQNMDMFQVLEGYGVTVKATGKRTIAEEMPHAYKDVAEVVDVVERAGLSKIVARVKPLVVIKG